jgi:hypothetical protein
MSHHGHAMHAYIWKRRDAGTFYTDWREFSRKRLGGPPSPETGDAMIVTDSISVPVASAVRTRWVSEPSVFHRVPHV